MKVSFEQKNRVDYIEGAIKLTNNTTEMVQNIILSFETLPQNLLECKVVRERGSLCFGATESSIPLGNLYPEEIAYLYCKIIPPPTASPTSFDCASQLRLTFKPENCELMSRALSELLS